MPTENSAGICVVGTGYWGRNLVRNIDQLGRLSGIYDSNRAAAAEVGERHPHARIYESFDEVLADPAIRAVLIATPAGQHAEMAIKAMRAGKDCFVEKPLALNAEEGQQMVEVARRNGRILMVGHLLRYHPAILAMHKLVQSGELGRLEYIYSNRLSMGKIRKEENALWSFAPHDISLILMLTGQMPLEVSAVGGSYLQPNIADVTVSNLLFERGTRAHIFVSWLHPYKEQRLVVIGSKKMVVFEDSRTTDKLLMFDKEIAWKDGNFQATAHTGVPVPYEQLEPLREECAHFLKCVDTRQDPLTPGEEGVEVLEVLQACQRSLELQGDPVQLRTMGRLRAVAV
jgi:UDP-2-acetamido-3-amino-2,3-dideoxy-glucuronate N-acetyltransferase